MAITPRDFVERWSQSVLREQQAAQSHFNELCELVNHRPPTQEDMAGVEFTFEKFVVKATGGKGRVDVWYKDRFAWEYKGKHKDLNAAYGQLLNYKDDLGNPPLLVVCDFNEYRIYPQWEGYKGPPIRFYNQDLLQAQTLNFIIWLLDAPDKFKIYLQRELKERDDITDGLAGTFADLAELMRDHKDPTGKPVWTPMQVARFITKITFALFAQDIGLLPTLGDKQPVFRYLLQNAANAPEEFYLMLRKLFQAMNGETKTFLMKPVAYFNGGLFADSSDGSGDGSEVLDLSQLLHSNAFIMLNQVSEVDWSRVSPSIFGTLFERALDPAKRAQLGAHYTSEADIRLIVEPVLMEPLMHEWAEIRAKADPLMATYLDKSAAPRDTQKAAASLVGLYKQMMDRLENLKVLDPACGSGNFLYVSLRTLKELEYEVRHTFAPIDPPFRDVVTPRQLYGIEKDPFAAKLAHIVVWIGYLQSRYEHEGVLHPRLKQTSQPHARELSSPILKDKNNDDEPDRIVNDDAIMRYKEDGTPYEPEWPEADVIMSNPPFLGGKRMRTELPHGYVDILFKIYEGRVPHEADLVTYWFEKARTAIERNQSKRAGMLATNSIRQTTNRLVLDRIKQTGDIFLAWSDREWILDGAAVRISVVGFDNGEQKEYVLDGAPVIRINSDLQDTIDATKARRLPENLGISFMADTKGGAFDIPSELAAKMLTAENKSGRSNSDVVRPWVNGLDITRRSRQMWIIDFGLDMPLEEAQLYELPFEYVKTHVLPERQQNRRESYRNNWWIHVEPRPGMRQALAHLGRYIATVIVAKYRIFTWLSGNVLPDHRLYVFARQDDYFFGILHSRLHELWSLRLGSTLEDRPSYVGATSFETFPFLWVPGKEATESAAYAAISAAAKQLNQKRDAWLNPPEISNLFGDADSKALKERTLTNLYNALEAYRTRKANGNNGSHSEPGAAAKFAPDLAELHDALDSAVLAAYGWSDLAGKLRTPEGDEELLRRLLALNLERAGKVEKG